MDLIDVLYNVYVNTYIIYIQSIFFELYNSYDLYNIDSSCMFDICTSHANQVALPPFECHKLDKKVRHLRPFTNRAWPEGWRNCGQAGGRFVVGEA